MAPCASHSRLRGSKREVLPWDLFFDSGHAHSNFPNRPITAHPAIPTSPASYAVAALSAPGRQIPLRATQSQPHGSNISVLIFHLLGHLLVSTSNAHTTHFWVRERLGDAASVFAPGRHSARDCGPWRRRGR